MPTFPFNPGDVVILNSSPDIPMTVEECNPMIDQRTQDNKQLYWVNVLFLDATGQPIRKGLAHNVLSLYRPVSDFVQPIGFNT